MLILMIRSNQKSFYFSFQRLKQQLIFNSEPIVTEHLVSCTFHSLQTNFFFKTKLEKIMPFFRINTAFPQPLQNFFALLTHYFHTASGHEYCTYSFKKKKQIFQDKLLLSPSSLPTFLFSLHLTVSHFIPCSPCSTLLRSSLEPCMVWLLAQSFHALRKKTMSCQTFPVYDMNNLLPLRRKPLNFTYTKVLIAKTHYADLS